MHAALLLFVLASVARGSDVSPGANSNSATSAGDAAGAPAVADNSAPAPSGQQVDIDGASAEPGSDPSRDSLVAAHERLQTIMRETLSDALGPDTTGLDAPPEDGESAEHGGLFAGVGAAGEDANYAEQLTNWNAEWSEDRATCLLAHLFSEYAPQFALFLSQGERPSEFRAAYSGLNGDEQRMVQVLLGLFCAERLAKAHFPFIAHTLLFRAVRSGSVALLQGKDFTYDHFVALLTVAQDQYCGRALRLQFTVKPEETAALYASLLERGNTPTDPGRLAAGKIDYWLDGHDFQRVVPLGAAAYVCLVRRVAGTGTEGLLGHVARKLPLGVQRAALAVAEETFQRGDCGLYVHLVVWLADVEISVRYPQEEKGRAQMRAAAQSIVPLHVSPRRADTLASVLVVTAGLQAAQEMLETYFLRCILREDVPAALFLLWRYRHEAIVGQFQAVPGDGVGSIVAVLQGAKKANVSLRDQRVQDCLVALCVLHSVQYRDVLAAAARAGMSLAELPQESVISNKVGGFMKAAKNTLKKTEKK